jgi:hypothetical protein
MIFTSKSNHMIRFVVTPGILCFGRTKYAYSISLIIIDQIHIRILIKIWKLVRRVVILTTYNKSTNNFIGLSHNKLNTKVSKMCIKKRLQLLIISSNSMTFIFFLFKLSTQSILSPFHNPLILSPSQCKEEWLGFGEHKVPRSISNTLSIAHPVKIRGKWCVNIAPKWPLINNLNSKIEKHSNSWRNYTQHFNSPLLIIITNGMLMVTLVSICPFS